MAIKNTRAPYYGLVLEVSRIFTEQEREKRSAKRKEQSQPMSNTESEASA